MTSLLNARSDSLLGAQRPRIFTAPEAPSSAGQEAIELGRMAGVNLDPWQEFSLHHGLGERADGKWAAFEVGLVAPRQNGKNGTVEVRELAGLYLFDERLIIHSAHEFATSLEAFRRLLELIEGRDEFSRRVKRVSRAHGEEGIELYGPQGRRVTGGQRIRFRTRTKGGGRGWSGDCLVLDEAMILQLAAVGALLPTLSARPNPQVWYTGSAVDKLIHEHGLVLARLRARALGGNDPALAYLEWSGDAESPDQVTEEMATDPEVWAQGNPALGIRITAEHIGLEQRAMDPRTFAVERLGVGDWPDTEPGDDDSGAIDRESWKACEDYRSKVLDPICIAFDVRPDRSSAAVASAGHNRDGKLHIEVVDHRAGTGWLIDRLKDLQDRHKPLSIRYDERSPAAALVKKLEAAGVKVEPITGREYAEACGSFYDAVDQQTLRHLGTPELDAAVRGAAIRPLGDAWAWSRKAASVDITPLVACTLAAWGFEAGQTSPPINVDDYRIVSL